MGIKNYNGSPKTVSVIAKADPHDPDSIVYEFELISRSDGKSDEDQDDKRAIQRAINAAQISELAGTETYGDGSLPGKYDEDGNFITWSDFNTGPHREASNAYIEAAESQYSTHNNIRPVRNNEGYMEMDQYDEIQDKYRQAQHDENVMAATERGGISFGSGLRQRYGHKYKYQGGKKTYRLRKKKTRRKKKTKKNKKVIII